MAVITSKIIIGGLKFIGAAALSTATVELTSAALEGTANRIRGNAQQFQECCNRITVEINNITNIHWEGDNSGVMNFQWITHQRPALDEMHDGQIGMSSDIFATVDSAGRTAQSIQASSGNIRSAR